MVDPVSRALVADLSGSKKKKLITSEHYNINKNTQLYKAFIKAGGDEEYYRNALSILPEIMETEIAALKTHFP